VLVQQKAFDALDKPAQDTLLSAATTAEKRGWQLSEAKDAEYRKELAAKGMQIAEPSAALKQELKPVRCRDR
jgi:TRAP-type transport system periplasmic protein